MTDALAATRDALRSMDRVYERLLLLVGPPGCGKTAVLQQLSTETGRPRVNINLAVSPRLLDLPLARRPSALPGLLNDLFAEDDEALMLDNLEGLFDPDLRFNPLSWLRGLGRVRTTVATWSGSIERGMLTYASDGHPEYRRELLGDTRAVLMTGVGTR